MLTQFEREHDVCSLYEMDMETPAGGPITVTLKVKLRSKLEQYNSGTSFANVIA